MSVMQSQHLEQGAHSHAGKHPLPLYFMWLLIAGAGLVPSVFMAPFQIGLDPSWILSLALAVVDGRAFGSDYVFNYGPLGFLWTRVGPGISRFIFIAYDIWVWAQLVWLAALVFKRWRLAAAAPFLLALFISAPFSGLITAFFAMLFSGVVRGSIMAFAAAGFSALLCFYIKINYGVILIPFWLMVLLVAVFSGKIKWYRAASLALVWSCLLIWSACLLNVTLPGYLKAGFYLIAGYNEAMFIPIDKFDRAVLPAWGILAAFAALTLWNCRSIARNIERVSLYVITALLLFITFKNGFVRADAPHILIFYATSPVVIGLLAIFEPRRPARMLIGLMCFALLAGLANSTFRIRDLPRSGASMLWPRTYLTELFNPETASQKYAFTLEEESARYIPPTVLSNIQTDSTDAVSTDIQSIFINHLKYNPRPVPQSYQAYNRYLDNLNAVKYASQSAPDTVIYQSKTIDRRHPFWDESITKRVMLTNYRFFPQSGLIFDPVYYLKRYPDIAAAVKDGKVASALEHYEPTGHREGRLPGFLYLKRRAQALACTYAMDRHVSLCFNTPFRVEHADDLLYLNAHVRYSFLGQLRGLLFQPAPIYASLTYADGQTEVFRACRPILETGVLLNKKISDHEDTATFFRTLGRENIEVASITFTTPHPASFRRAIPCDIWRLRFN
ncbi:MAG: hypothetical protein WCL16_07880 [bacterium]